MYNRAVRRHILRSQLETERAQGKVRQDEHRGNGDRAYLGIKRAVGRFVVGALAMVAWVLVHTPAATAAKKPKPPSQEPITQGCVTVTDIHSIRTTLVTNAGLEARVESGCSVPIDVFVRVAYYDQRGIQYNNGVEAGTVSPGATWELYHSPDAPEDQHALRLAKIVEVLVKPLEPIIKGCVTITGTQYRGSTRIGPASLRGLVQSRCSGPVVVSITIAYYDGQDLQFETGAETATVAPGTTWRFNHIPIQPKNQAALRYAKIVNVLVVQM
jgi:hypothetical protein